MLRVTPITAAERQDRSLPSRVPRLRLALPLAALALMLSACASTGYPGPTTKNIRGAEGREYADADIRIVELTGAVAERLHKHQDARSFANVFGGESPSSTIIGRGDLLEISLWEASPPVLFGGTFAGERAVAYDQTAPSVNLPIQMVDDEGIILVPFAGAVYAVGKTPVAVAREIRDRLVGKAHDPQAIVRLVQNETRNVTVLGEVAANRRVPLTSRGERVLDIIAAAGGSRHPIDKSTIQVTRGQTMQTLPLETLIQDPAQNVYLRANDIVTVLFQPHSFIGLGAVTRNTEVDFEGGGITLAQALGRLGGLIDTRADVHGVFVYRLEDPDALDPATVADARTTEKGLVPVIYRLDLSQASSMFVAREFMIRDNDVVYVSVAPLGDLEKFVRILSSAVNSANGLDSLLSDTGR